MSVQPIEQDISTLLSKLNLRLRYIQEAIEKLRDCRSSRSQQQEASELREDMDTYEKEAQVNTHHISIGSAS